MSHEDPAFAARAVPAPHPYAGLTPDRVLDALDGWLKRQPAVSSVRWHRKEDWMAEDTSSPAERPVG